MDNNSGGPGEAKDPLVSQLVLTFNRQVFQMQITGHTANLDEALCMLEIAKRDIASKLAAASVNRVIDAPARVPFQFPRRGGD